LSAYISRTVLYINVKLNMIIPQVLIEKEEANSLKDGEKSLADLVALTVGTLGENMALRRAAHLKADPDTLMTCFVHAAGRVRHHFYAPLRRREGILLCTCRSVCLSICNLFVFDQ